MNRQDDLRNLSREYEDKIRSLMEKLADTRSKYDGELRHAESERINAIRAVDVAAVAQAAQVSATQATTLAAQVTASAETLRNTVAASATAAANALSQALQPIQKSIDDLRQAQYQQQGQQAQKTEGQDSGRFIIATIVSVAGLLMTITLALGAYFISHPAH
jgi:cobalamin biosynthesis Mg chelatase CobN